MYSINMYLFFRFLWCYMYICFSKKALHSPCYVSKLLIFDIKWVLHSILYITFHSKFCKPWIISEQNSKRVLTSLAARIVYASNCFIWNSRTRVVGRIGKCWWSDRMLSSTGSDTYAGSRSWERLVTPTCQAVPKCWRDNTTGLRIHFS